MDILKEILKRHEGLRLKVYLDSERNLTVGYGHHLYVGDRINRKIAEKLLEIDISEAVSEFFKLDIRYIKKLNIPRRRAILNMIFNMNFQKVLGFKKMWAAIGNNDYKKAAAEMLDSKWATQVGKRANDLAKVMEAGDDSFLYTHSVSDPT